jgi:hypothetical protein
LFCAHALVLCTYLQGELVITDGSTNISNDEHVQQLQPGQRLLVRPAQQGADQPVFKVGAAFLQQLLDNRIYSQDSSKQQHE